MDLSRTSFSPLPALEVITGLKGVRFDVTRKRGWGTAQCSLHPAPPCAGTRQFVLLYR
jgi:hypothetical protein